MPRPINPPLDQRTVKDYIIVKPSSEEGEVYVAAVDHTTQVPTQNMLLHHEEIQGVWDMVADLFGYGT